MKLYSIAPIVMATISMSSAVSELRLWLRTTSRSDTLPFALTCFGLSLYCIACAGLYSVSVPAQSVPWSRAQAVSFCIMGIFFFWFVSRHTGKFPKLPLRIFTVLFCVGILVLIIGFGDLTWQANKPFVKHAYLPFGLSLEINEVATGPLSDILQASGFIGVLFVVRATVAYMREGKPREHRALGFAVGIVGAAFSVDFLITHGLIHIPYTLEYSWLGFILIMSTERARQLKEGYQAKLALVESERRFRTIVEESFDVIVVCNPEGRALFLSPSFGRVLGYETDVFLGSLLVDLVHPEDREGLAEDMKMPTLSDGRTISIFRVRRSDGEWAIMEVIVSRFGTEPEGGGFLLMGRDITERKRAEDAILASLREKELLLKEVHHRVKNNLQVISSLLSFQVRKSDDPRVVAVVEESRNQIYAMAVVHEELYRQSDFSRIDFGACVKRLGQHLLGSMGKEGAIALVSRIEEVQLGIDAAMPCALILNELVTNALLHGFPDPNPPQGAQLRIELERCGEERAALSVSDNGVGLPAEGAAETRGRGLQIVAILTKQLQGTVNMESGAGVRVRVEFPVDGT